ncbi:MAG: hypothetical protein J7M38_04485 [Armatimonadetes bacterium]|nr:hypothetical protein [Armatimonadota bacterium]
MHRLRSSFAEQIKQVETTLTRLAEFVTEMLGEAMKSLIEQDEALAERVIYMDDVADDLDMEIERGCMRLLALQQPMARDLRTISNAMKVSTDYERVGDYSVDIARSARALRAMSTE